MRYYLDCEFLERPCTIDLLSLALVREDGEELYLVSTDCDLSQANDFVRTQVIPNVYHPGPPQSDPHCQTYVGHVTLKLTRDEIAQKVLAFVGTDPAPVFYGYFADYDWVCFCWLFGTMMELPKGWPMYCYDLKQLAEEFREHTGTDVPAMLQPVGDEHNALVDARFNKRLHEALLTAIALLP